MRHKIKTYATIKMVKGVRTTLEVFSCGPCQLYAQYFTSREGRTLAIERHLNE